MTAFQTPVEAEQTTVISCESVSREYIRDRPRTRFRPWRAKRSVPTVTALRDVSLRVRRGEMVGIAGPSGSGKSTLLHLLAALDTPTSGIVELEGTDTSSLTERQRTRLRLARVGIVFQRFHLLPSLSARANVALPLVERGVGKRKRRERATDLLERVGLGDRLSHKPGELSGGEQQRVAIARALSTDPSVLIADEPTGELDTETGARILDLFTELSADRAVILASHDEPALDATDRLIRLLDGRRVDEDYDE